VNGSTGTTITTTPDVPQPPATECAFKGEPGIPFFWDVACTEDLLGCKADGANVQCRYCGEPPYESISCEVQAEWIPRSEDLLPRETAWIVVGGGAAGCAAAAALADAGEDVLVFERGKSDREVIETQQAGTWPFVVNTEAAEHVQWEEGVWGTAAKVLGGGTSINGGYSFEETPDWIRNEFGPLIDLDVFHRSSEQLAKDLAHPVQPNDFGHAWSEALCEAGHGCANASEPLLRLKENGAWVPLDTFNMSKAGWPRRSSAVLLHERAHLPNLRTFTSALVHRVLFNGTRAVGVRVSLAPAQSWWPKRPVNIIATKGVIVSAGAVYTPQILQMSGVGEAALLERLGVPIVSDLPVGKNFIDRLVMNLAFKGRKEIPLSIGWVVALSTSLNMTIEVEAGGSINSEFAIASLALDAPQARHAHLRSFMKSVMRYPHNQQPSALADNINNAMDILVLQHEANSRGFVEAQSLDPAQPPRVSANYFADKEKRDYHNQWRGIQELLKIAGTKAMEPWVGRKTEVPIPDAALSEGLKCALLGEGIRGTVSQDNPYTVIPCLPLEPATNEEWDAWFKEHHVSSYHYFGTAPYGTVLEGREFTVKGTTGLHVVDASIFPNPTRVNPQHMIMAMGHYLGTMLGYREAGHAALKSKVVGVPATHAEA